MVSRLLWLEPIWLLGLGPFVLLPGVLAPIDFYVISVILLFLFWPLRWLSLSSNQFIRSGQGTRQLFVPLQAPLSLVLLMVIALSPISLWASVDHQATWTVLGYSLYGIALYVATINWPLSRHRPEIVAALLGVMGMVLVAVSPFLVQFKLEFRLFYLPLYDTLHSLTLGESETIHANVLAGALVLIAPLFVAVTVAPGGRRDTVPSESAVRPWLRILTAACGTLAVAMIVLTQSRGAYLALVAALLMIILLRWPKLIWGAIPLGLLAFMLVDRLDTQRALDALSKDGSLGGWEGRLDTWQYSLLAIRDFPLTGIGAGTFPIVLPLLYPLRFGVESYPHAHNYFLQVGVDLGVLGLIALVACILIVSTMAGLLYRWRRSLSPLAEALAVGCIASLAAILVHGIFDAVLWGTKLAFLPWLLYALVTTLFLRNYASWD